MAYRYHWEIQDRLLYVRYSGVMTSEEMLRSMEEVGAVVRQSGYSFVHIIVDVTAIIKPVAIADQARIFRQFKLPENLGWLITVGETNPFIKFSMSLASQIFGQRMHSVASREAALGFLGEVDPPLKAELDVLPERDKKLSE